jgi:predicted Zn-dependent protease
MNKKKYTFRFLNDSGVGLGNRYESQSALYGACDTILTAGLAPNLIAQKTSDGKALTDLSDMFRMSNGQLNIDKMYGAMVGANYLSPNDPKFILLSSDLTPSENYNYIYGFAMKETGLVVTSTYRFRNIGSAACSLALRHIASHETAHMLGLDSSTIKRVDQSTGHCANECTMRQVNNLEETLSLANTLKNKRAAGFCIDCAGVLREINC